LKCTKWQGWITVIRQLNRLGGFMLIAWHKLL
jgi:hypothetical protein